MFTRRGYGDVKKSTQKVLDPKKDVFARLKHLRALLDITDRNELKSFFETNCSQIYFIFYENFITLESNLKQKGNKSQREELDSILFIFEVTKIVPEEITPLVPAVPGEKVADDHTCSVLQIVLKVMVLQASSLDWKNKENQDTGFRFLFSLFKKYYLPHLFPSFTKQTNLYKPQLDLPIHRPKPLYVPVTRNSESTYCTRDQYLAPRVAFITWLVNFFLEKKYVNSATSSSKNGGEVLPKIIQTVTAGSISQEKSADSEPNGPVEQEKNHSNSSTLSDRRGSNSSLCSIEEEHRPIYDMVQSILLSTRDNVNFVNEVFHQAFLLPACEASATRKVIKVYRKWILQEKPNFMGEPEITSGEDGEEEHIISETDNAHVHALVTHGHKRSSSWGRTYSFSSAISRGCLTEQNLDVKAGIQPALQVFLTNSANVFLLEPCQDVPKLLENQLEVCRAVLSVYRHIIMEQNMNRQTWEQLLQVLLRITEAVMRRPQENQRKDTFAHSLASVLFKTIFVAWVRANLTVFISRELWDELLSVLSSLSHWEELVFEWASIMDSLTAVLARHVYGLDLHNLPLDKLSEQKEKKQRGRGVMQDSQKSTDGARSFSLSWRGSGDQVGAQEPMRFRSATTTGAPAVEKARNNVRQKASAKRSQSISNCVHLCEALPATKSVPMLLHTVSSFLPGISHNSHCSHRLSDVEECQLSECEMGDGDSPLPRSSSTSDITQQISDTFPGQKRDESVDTGRASVSESSFTGKRESEAPTILIRRSSSPADLDYPNHVITNIVNITYLLLGESVSSETSNGYLNDAEVGLLSWHAVEEEPDSPSTHDMSMSMSVTADTVSQRSLLLSHTEALAGSDPHCPPVSPALLVPHGCCEGPQLLEDAMNLPHHLDSSEFLADDISIIAGGSLTGWHADSAFVLWRRILGILGDVNSIRCARIHAKVFSYLYELWHKLAKIRDNLGIRVDTDTAMARPLFIPPLRMLASWLFKATMLPSEFKAGKLQAYKLICEMMTKHQDVLPNSDFLVHLYHVMHKGFTSDDQDVLNTMIRWCSPRFFFLGLPGFTMLVGDFITAAARVLNTDSFEAPRIEAQTVLGSLVCFPNLYQQIPSLQSVPGSEDIVVGKEDMKDYLVNILLKTARNETCEGARCVAICSLGLWVCEELRQTETHHQVKDAINVLGVTLKFGNKVVANVACDIFQLLISHWQHLHRLDPFLPKRIIEIFVATIAFLLPSAEHSTVEADKKLMVSLLLCLLDWCMAVPLSILLEPITMPVLDDPASQKAPLLDYIYRVLHTCVSGSNLHTQQSHYLLSLADLSTDYEPFLTLGNVKSFEPPPVHNVMGDFGNLLTVAEEKKRRSMELIPLTARMVMTHLVNHLGHHPLSGGPALLNSLVSENHDNPYVESSELSSEVFKSPNLQLFVFNDSTLVSYLQIPSDNSSTAAVGANPRDHSSEVRVIVRDISGKYSWDGSVLFRTLDGTGLSSGGGRDQLSHDATRSEKQGSVCSSKCSSELEVEDGVDVLDKLLEDLGYSSPECLPQPQLRLTQPPSPPIGMNPEMEGLIIDAIHRQAKQEDEELARRQTEDPSIRADRQREPTHQEPKSPFYLCRLILNDLGMNSWDRRKSFHLLKKNSKLLRELKNLDSRQCRETHKIAVFYIGEGQEDKCSILSNTEGSQAYEDFVSGLGWEVNLATHCGFLGGLQRNGSTGSTAPYYATSNVEVIFHVSTRMPSDSEDSITKKLRHLGNDEVHIVWSEHTRDYRRGIIPTDFGDVLIIIYPMKNHMFFVQIMKKPQVPFFGPLFDGAIVTGTLLPSLVRATCINASRAVKSRLPLYQSFYEERALYLEAIIQNHKENMTFEDFAAQVFSPSPSYWPTGGAGSLSCSTSADLSVTVTTNDSVDQVSPTIPRASKNRVSGKLRRSASAISKSSN
ncbi:ral GTPase-activating protein subunit alpha-2 [Garra rufa]|uniref:ral GTPase-activating protein subunit alpha-2 n=1 Tax=Garra rufa TaxID=137080 RepID=UPI003CCEDCC6